MQFLPVFIDEKKVYAGFWKRLKALLIDFIITAPILYMAAASRRSSYAAALIATLFMGGFYVLYHVFFNARLGGSPGKLAMGLKVTRSDGTPIGWTQAWMRSSVDALHGLMFIYLYLFPVLHVDSASYSAMSSSGRVHLLSPYRPPWYHVADSIWQVWYWSEIGVILFNQRKRALHDFMAGTVVIHERFAKQAAGVHTKATAPA